MIDECLGDGRMLDISLVQMKYAIEVYKAGSISRAAKKLSMNQPNLSKSIKELEDSLGIEIFVRTPKGVIVSKEGQVFLEYADAIFQKMDEMEDGLRECKENKVSFKVSIPRATYITYAFTKFIKDIQSTPEIRINYRETNAVEAADNILYHGFDLGVVRYTEPYEIDFQQSLERKGLISKDYWESEYLLLMSKKHPLAEKEEIVSDDIEEYTELVHGDENYDKTNPTGDINKRIYLYERGSQFDLLRNVPTTYMWVSPLPEEILESNDLIQRKCSDSKIRFKDALIYRSDYQFSQFASQFVDTLLYVRDEIMENILKD